MSAELIYHDVGGDENVSVFDKNVKDIVEGKDVKLISPYVGRSYLRELTSLAESWRLVTDLDEMVSSVRSSQSEETHRFFVDNSERIRSLKDVHAKAIITDKSAVVGSANLTQKGIAGRTEIAVRFDSGDEADELNEWFNELWEWEEAEKIEEERITEAVESAVRKNRSRDRKETERTSGSYKSSPVSKKLHTVAGKDEEDYDELVRRVGQMPNRDWASRFFDLFSELIEFTSMTSDDPRLVSSMPQDRDKIAVTVNRRYVLVAYPQSNQVGVTLPERDERFSEFFDYDFSAVSGESVEETPNFYMFPEPEEKIAEVKEDWKEAINHELELAESAPRRKKHNPVVYRVAVDSVFRQRVLRDSFY